MNAPARQLDRSLGLLHATASNMATMVGIGPFITFPLIVSAMGGPQAMLGWVVGALIAISDGQVWGRGAVDMLNLTSSMAVAFKHLAASGFTPKGTLIYLAVADEEALGTHGAEFRPELRPERGDRDHAAHGRRDGGGEQVDADGSTEAHPCLARRADQVAEHGAHRDRRQPEGQRGEQRLGG